MYDATRVNTIIALVGNYLREKLPKDNEELAKQLVELEALRFQLLEVTVDWQQLLAEKKGQYLHPKDSNFTELDRRVMLNAHLANIERDVNFLLGLELLVTQHLQLGKALLAK